MILQDSPQEIQELAVTWPLCFEFKLPPEAIVIVAGAYQGKVVQLLADLYPDHKAIIGFEPQYWATQLARERLESYHKCHIMAHAIGLENGKFPMGEWNTDACSFVNTEVREKGYGIMVEFNQAMIERGIEHIDLAVFNMEGYEFLLISYLLRTGWLGKIDRLAVQWHINLGAGGKEEVVSLVKEIQDSHHLVYDHRPQWTYTENWKLWESRK